MVYKLWKFHVWTLLLPYATSELNSDHRTCREHYPRSKTGEFSAQSGRSEFTQSCWWTLNRQLVIEYKFDKLSVANTCRLCIELGVSDKVENIHELTSLAEIYVRQNATARDSENGLENDLTTMKNKWPMKKKKH